MEYHDNTVPLNVAFNEYQQESNEQSNNQGTMRPSPKFPSLVIDTQITTPSRRLSTTPMRQFEVAGVSFGNHKQLRKIMSFDSSIFYQTQMNGRINGGFFYNNNVLTCYRRNFFKIFVAFQLLGMNSNTMQEIIPQNIAVLDDNEEPRQISGFHVSISAYSNSMFQKNVEISMAVPSSSGKTQSSRCSPVSRQIIPDPSAVFMLESMITTPRNASKYPTTQNINGSIVTFDRLQFKQATANNGKRTDIQQFYQLKLTLTAECTDGSTFEIAECTSENIVVRGRSPSHYADVDKSRRSSNIRTPVTTIHSAAIISSQLPSGLDDFTPTPGTQNRRFSWTSALSSLTTPRDSQFFPNIMTNNNEIPLQSTIAAPLTPMVNTEALELEVVNETSKSSILSTLAPPSPMMDNDLRIFNLDIGDNDNGDENNNMNLISQDSTILRQDENDFFSLI